MNDRMVLSILTCFSAVLTIVCLWITLKPPAFVISIMEFNPLPEFGYRIFIVFAALNYAVCAYLFETVVIEYLILTVRERLCLSASKHYIFLEKSVSETHRTFLFEVPKSYALSLWLINVLSPLLLYGSRDFSVFAMSLHLFHSFFLLSLLSEICGPKETSKPFLSSSYSTTEYNMEHEVHSFASCLP